MVWVKPNHTWTRLDLSYLPKQATYYHQQLSIIVFCFALSCNSAAELTVNLLTGSTWTQRQDVSRVSCVYTDLSEGLTRLYRCTYRRQIKS
ncbi:hypothetical protein Q5P01_016678 [Channa striata]|uniref:Uncharacterized protein n=1 Tax=Channa striata TaxID=64152 RepID=A0AA88SAQ0_CHASR|nr:hypothetical protein Q5P01_016678 [Channa striata]